MKKIKVVLFANLLSLLVGCNSNTDPTIQYRDSADDFVNFIFTEMFLDFDPLAYQNVASTELLKLVDQNLIDSEFDFLKKELWNKGVKS